METETHIPDAAAKNANPLNFGFFSTKNCVRPEETQEYEAMAFSLWSDLNPVGALEQMYAAEIVRYSWRLRRYAVAEHELGLRNAFDPMLNEKDARIQTDIDRSRARADSGRRRAIADLRELQTERWLRREAIPDGYDTSSLGVASMAQMVKARLQYQRLKKAAEDKTPPYKTNSDAPDEDGGYNVHTMICRCGSGLRFKECCGDTQVHRR